MVLPMKPAYRQAGLCATGCLTSASSAEPQPVLFGGVRFWYQGCDESILHG